MRESEEGKVKGEGDGGRLRLDKRRWRVGRKWRNADGGEDGGGGQEREEQKRASP